MRAVPLVVVLLGGSGWTSVAQESAGSLSRNPGVLIRAVDAESGEELPQITIVQLHDRASTSWGGPRHPGTETHRRNSGDTQLLAVDVPSPCLVQASDWNGSIDWNGVLCVSAPDHAWDRIEVDSAAEETEGRESSPRRSSTLAELMAQRKNVDAFGSPIRLFLTVKNLEAPYELLLAQPVRVAASVHVAGLPEGSCVISTELGCDSGSYIVGVSRVNYWNRIDVDPEGATNVVVQLPPPAYGFLRLVDGTTELPWYDVHRGEVTMAPVAGPGKVRATGGPVADYGTWWQVESPGRWRVTLPELRFYRTVPPFDVDVPSGEFITQTVELVRRP